LPEKIGSARRTCFDEFNIVAFGFGADLIFRPKEAAQAVPIAEEPISATLAIDSIRLELGYGLLTLMNQAEGSRLTDQIRGLRRQLASEMGFVLPPVRIQDNLQLPATGYVVRIKEIEAGDGEILPALHGSKR